MCVVGEKVNSTFLLVLSTAGKDRRLFQGFALSPEESRRIARGLVIPFLINERVVRVFVRDCCC